jgi:hypothetical protein
MSYCRFSSDNWKSDVYVYAHVDGTWTTHVAGRKRVGELPEHPSWNEPIDDDWMRRAREHAAAVSAAEMVPIGLPHDGKTFKDGSPGECWATLVMLKTAGYHVPQYALDELYDEANEDATQQDKEACRG